jgi:hypothetical protein
LGKRMRSFKASFNAWVSKLGNAAVAAVASLDYKFDPIARTFIG